MQVRKGRIARWFPITLGVVGSFALLIGIFVAVLSIPRVVAAGHPGSNLPTQGALYVGTNTCFTCHRNRPLDWSLTLYTQIVVNAPEKPKAVVNLKSAKHVQQIDANAMVEAYTSTDETTLWQNPSHQFYVIKTEDGHVLLPTQQAIDGTQMGSNFSKCSTCHTANLKVKPLGSVTKSLALLMNLDLI